ncbi:MAG: hypothetical protein WBP55_05545 [Solirubrobacterales bacterium]
MAVRAARWQGQATGVVAARTQGKAPVKWLTDRCLPGDVDE